MSTHSTPLCDYDILTKTNSHTEEKDGGVQEN